MRKLVRSRNGILGGVCAGIGRWIGIGEGLGEFIGILLWFYTEWFWWVYILLWIFMDVEDTVKFN